MGRIGTRADFWIGRGLQAEWLGSIAWDGMSPDDAVLRATDEATYRAAVATCLASREDGTTPDMGWPWPWEDSSTTDYAYAFDGGEVWTSNFGSTWYSSVKDNPEIEVPAVFPDMSAVQKVTLGPRSGVIILGGGSLS